MKPSIIKLTRELYLNNRPIKEFMADCMFEESDIENMYLFMVGDEPVYYMFKGPEEFYTDGMTTAECKNKNPIQLLVFLDMQVGNGENMQYISKLPGYNSNMISIAEDEENFI